MSEFMRFNDIITNKIVLLCVDKIDAFTEEEGGCKIIAANGVYAISQSIDEIWKILEGEKNE